MKNVQNHEGGFFQTRECLKMLGSGYWNRKISKKVVKVFEKFRKIPKKRGPTIMRRRYLLIQGGLLITPGGYLWSGTTSTPH